MTLIYICNIFLLIYILLVIFEISSCHIVQLFCWIGANEGKLGEPRQYVFIIWSCFTSSWVFEADVCLLVFAFVPRWNQIVKVLSRIRVQHTKFKSELIGHCCLENFISENRLSSVFCWNSNQILQLFPQIFIWRPFLALVSKL